MAETQMRGENVSVPVIVDGYVPGDPAGLARCVYFSIVSDEPDPGWVLLLEDVAPIPFLMLGLQGIIHRPADPRRPTFDESWLLSELIIKVENRGFSVDTAYLWLPNPLLERGWRKAGVDEETTEFRGSVFRLSHRTFRSAFAAANEGKHFERTLEVEDDQEPAAYSAVETEAIREWSRIQVIEFARFPRR